MHDKSGQLWGLLHDLDQAIAAYRAGVPHREILELQRRQVRILLEMHHPEECPEEWKDD